MDELRALVSTLLLAVLTPALACGCAPLDAGEEDDLEAEVACDGNPTQGPAPDDTPAAEREPSGRLRVSAAEARATNPVAEVAQGEACGEATCFPGETCVGCGIGDPTWCVADLTDDDFLCGRGTCPRYGGVCVGDNAGCGDRGLCRSTADYGGCSSCACLEEYFARTPGVCLGGCSQNNQGELAIDVWFCGEGPHF